MAHFEDTIETLLDFEGRVKGQVPNDPGGFTAFGWTLSGYRDFKRDAEVQDLEKLTLEEAKGLYEKLWNKWKLYYIENEIIATKLFLALVNLGSYNAWRLAQTAASWAGKPILADGVLGTNSRAAINSCRQDDFIQLYSKLISEFYQKHTNPHFLPGLLRRAWWPEPVPEV